MCGAARVAIPAQNRFHLIFKVQLALLEGDFFELFWFGEVVPGGKVVDSFVEVVVLSG